MLYISESSNPSKSRAGLILTSLEGVVVEHVLHFGFKASNNKNKYEALLVGLKVTQKLGVRHLKALSDFQLVVRQVEEEFEARDLGMAKDLMGMAKYLKKVWDISLSFAKFEIL